VTAVRRTDVQRETARRPAPFTQSQVDELVRGALSDEAIAAVLESFSVGPEGKRVRSTKQSPVSVEPDELRRLAEDGVTPAEVAKRLQAAAGKAPPFAKEGRAAGDRPTKKPPQSQR
jgi:hypothetical protein